MSNISHYEYVKIDHFNSIFNKEVIKNTKEIWAYVYDKTGIKLYPNMCELGNVYLNENQEDYIELQLIYRSPDGMILDISVDMEDTSQFVFSCFNSKSTKKDDIGVVDCGFVSEIKTHNLFNNCLQILYKGQ